MEESDKIFYYTLRKQKKEKKAHGIKPQSKGFNLPKSNFFLPGNTFKNYSEGS